uniref:Uncharacterized protein n=1 Tax=Ditylenchus dipsaci TaxID=166011 RepID=A0A915EKV0_9BILA
MSFGSLIVIVLVGFILLSIISEQQVEAKSKEGNKGGVPTKKPKVPKGKKSTPKFKRKTTTRKRKKTTKKNRDKKSTLRWKRFCIPKIKRCGPKDKYFDVAQKNLKDVKIEKADKIKGVKCTSDKDCYPVVQECRMSSISKAKYVVSQNIAIFE